jgi:hypothetical protein
MEHAGAVPRLDQKEELGSEFLGFEGEQHLYIRNGRSKITHRLSLTPLRFRI